MLKPPQSKRWRACLWLLRRAKRLECGVFTAALAPGGKGFPMIRCMRLFFILAGICLVAISASAAVDLSKLPPVATRPVDFAKDIQPLLADRCYQCHGSKKQESGLRLDLKADALKGGDHGAAMIPGDSSKSLIVHVTSGAHDELARMPKKGDALSAEQIGVLRGWIDQGAVWPDALATAKTDNRDHWAFRAPVRPKPPTIQNAKLKIRNPIDAFVLARLDKEGLKPSPEADKTVLIRRLSLDLTGLPPSPAEVDAFLADTSRDAYEKLVERLLASPHYGEKWARHWLDAARYADSNGFEKDRTRSIWPYRDWVINAINADKPFDQFTIEQLAGDLLINEPTFNTAGAPDSRVATGFLRNSMMNMEGGIEPEKFRVESMIDRVDAVGRTWLGLTIACAQCHNHKFDPISQKEYYQFYAFLNNDDEPRIEVPTRDQATKRAEILARARALEDKLLADAGTKIKFDRWLESSANKQSHWQPLNAKEWHSTPMKFEKQEDLSLLAGGDVYNTGVLRVWVDVQETNITGFRLEALNNANLPFNGPGLDGKGDFMVVEFTVEATPLSEIKPVVPGVTNAPATTNKIVFSRAVADWESPEFPASAMIDGITTNGGWASALTAGRRNEERRAVFETDKPFGFDGGTRLLITMNCKPPGGLNVTNPKLSNFLPGRVRLSLTTQTGPIPVDPLSERQRQLLGGASVDARRELMRAYVFHDPSLAESAKSWDALWNDWPVAETTTLALSSRPMPRATSLFRRGDWQRLGDEVSADTPKVLPPFQPDLPRNRLGLARWIVDSRNPLTARVMVNRVWQQYFGQGLVTTPEDFGTRADKPLHPELLDWLACEFMAPSVTGGGKSSSPKAWSLKQLHRTIVTSATYRQSSKVTPALLEKDPYNHLLAHGPRFRVDAEAVQDIALKTSGLLSEKIGGPSVFPSLPEGVMQLSYGPIAWNVSEGDDRYRRAMYTFWKRSVPYPAMVTFDAPTAEQSCVRRVRSNTPLQALITLNDPTFNQSARWLGWRVLQEGGANDDARLTYAFRLCTSRRPDPRELKTLRRLLDDSRQEFAATPKNAAQVAFNDPKNPVPLPAGATMTDLAAWSAVSRALLNLDETLTKE